MPLLISEAVRKPHYLQVRDMKLIESACRDLHTLFPIGVFLVGSALYTAQYRDIDIRAIAEDDHFKRLFPQVDQEEAAWADAEWSVYCLSVSALLSRMTGGLDIDFQVQSMKYVQHLDAGSQRHRNAIRDLNILRAPDR